MWTGFSVHKKLLRNREPQLGGGWACILLKSSPSPNRQFFSVLLCTYSTAPGLSVAVETAGWLGGWGGSGGLGIKIQKLEFSRL